MNNIKCTFYSMLGVEHCRILNECKCDGCSFRKTEDELEKSREDAEKLLCSKGLKSVVKKDKNGNEIVSTETIKENTKQNNKNI